MALYNTERPMTFSEVLGQDKVVKIFKEIIKSGNTPNAFLFIGVRGTGKTSSARLFERALNCEHPQEDGSPCNECASCKEILAGNSLDVIELDAASHGGVDDVHEVLKMVQYTPIHKKKILVLDEVHMLSNAAFNALLKTIEEPPKDVVFIFCTTEEHKVPATIISRCRRFVFERISDDVIEGKLREICDKNGVKAEDEALGIIARAAKGGMRDALSILEQFLSADITVDIVKETLGIADEDAIFDILCAIAKGEVVNAVSTLRDLIKRGKNLEVLLKALIDGLVDAVYTMQSGKCVNNTQLYIKGVNRYIEAVENNASKSLSFVDQFSKVYEVSRKDADMSYALEMTIMKMVDYSSEIESLKQRITALENRAVSSVSASVVSVEAPAEPETETSCDEDTYYASLASSFEEEPTFGDMPIEVNDAEIERAEKNISPVQPPVEPKSGTVNVENTSDDEIPFDVPDLTLDGFKQGEGISLASLLGGDTLNASAQTTEEKPAAPEETPVQTEQTPSASAEEEECQVEEPDVFGEFFDLGSARQF